MKTLISVCSAILLATTMHGEQASSHSPVAGSPEAQFVSLTNQWTAAIVAKDRSKLDALMSPDFVLQGWDGTWHVERPQWLENLFQSYDIAEYHHSDIGPHVYGDVAAVTSKYYWRGKRGRGEKEPFEEHGYVVDVWRRSGDRWQVVSRITIILTGKEEPASAK
jgi:ketosteroid isomerase-like protein